MIPSLLETALWLFYIFFYWWLGLFACYTVVFSAYLVLVVAKEYRGSKKRQN